MVKFQYSEYKENPTRFDRKEKIGHIQSTENRFGFFNNTPKARQRNKDFNTYKEKQFQTQDSIPTK